MLVLGGDGLDSVLAGAGDVVAGVDGVAGVVAPDSLCAAFL